MAPSKKKKKPASNPARGFATVSTASKPKIDKNAESTDASEVGSFATAPTPVSADDMSSKPVKEETKLKELHELNPEEFERRLEESELQALLESIGPKCKRESGRQVTRLRTDRRLLRGQADVLSTRNWLPPELLGQIMDFVNDEMSHGKFHADQDNKLKTISEEELTAKIWTLQQTLLELHFREELVWRVLKWLLDHPPSFNPLASTMKDSIWGLEESLDWLAIECDLEELPDYELRDRDPGRSRPTAASEKGDTPEVLGSTTSLTDNLPERPKLNVNKELKVTPAVAEESPGTVVSDLESDLDPEELLSTYLTTRSHLYALQPNLVAENPRKLQKSKPSKTNRNTTTTTLSPQIKNLQNKLKKIESDILFDQYEADRKWIDIRNDLAQQSAARRKLELDEPGGGAAQNGSAGHLPGQNSVDEVSREAEEIASSLLQDPSFGEDGDGVLGDMFSNASEDRVGPGSSLAADEAPNDINVTIRDFGKWNGMNPRRVLEDACRARDSSAKLSHKVISSSSFSIRNNVTVSWSKDQEPVLSSPFSSVLSSSDNRSSSFSMLSIATPDKTQSEAYISTVALFLLFSSSPKEEKVHLRLPPIWRDLWDEFSEAKREQDDEASRRTLRELRDLVREIKDREDEDGIVLRDGFKKRNALNGGLETGEEGEQKEIDTIRADPEQLQSLWAQKSSSPMYQAMLRSRMQLPMWSFKDEVLAAIDRQQVVIICGETGCGKSTQVPSFILEHQLSQGRNCRIYCTEPRRISAISLARRVSEELGERKNDLGTSRSMVGYAIRLESNITSQTRLVYATTGIVMRMLEGSSDLRDVSHLILDEVHERSIDSDFLLIVLRKLLYQRPDLKVVLMSATVDAKRFSSYLDGAPILTVPGRTFPVQTRFLEDAVELTNYTIDSGKQQNTREIDLDDADTEDSSEPSNPQSVEDLRDYSARTRRTLSQFDEYRIDYNLVTRLIEKIAVDARFEPFSKAILVFLPGMAEIRQLNDMLAGHPSFSQGWYIYPLHSTIASEDQERAFLVPPDGIRKIVLATNIAETGITIPDVTCVIDTGKHKEMRFDERRQLSRLIESFISRANAKQRRGRAGRVQEGLCFHLFTKARHDRQMAEQQTPEMLRLSLQDLVLRVKICKLGDIEQTLSEALDPPSSKNIRRAIDALIDVKALTASEELTALGRQLAKLPLDVQLGKLVLLGSVFKCLDATLTIAAVLSSKAPFSAPVGARAQADLARLSFKRGDSDLLTIYNAYCAWKRVCTTPGASEFQFCRKNLLSSQTLSNIEDLKSQLLVALTDAGFLTLGPSERAALNKSRTASRRRNFFTVPISATTNSENDLIVNSVIAWSFYPKVLTRDGKGWRNVANNQSVSLHPTSVNKGSSSSSVKWLSFYHIMQSSNKFYNAHETSAADAFAIALLCGDAEFKTYAGVVILDGNRVRFSVRDWKTLVALKALRMRLRDLLAKSFRSPGARLTAREERWFAVWTGLFARKVE
ncbi:MAG: hypothetical protein M1819_001022 [Sarea resinae]|nr:MAG: hypothetical protein M1819_001022 [Sarea resinae]